jgi:DNA-binding NtrC family response regulator
MTNKVIVLISPDSDPEIEWESIGTVVSELAELYQEVKDTDYEVLLFDETRPEINPAVTSRLHRRSPLMDIWRLVSDRYAPEEASDFVDGQLSTSLGHEGIVKRLSGIIAQKRLLDQFGMIGRAPQMKAMAEVISRIAPTEVSVLIQGPSGAGKELVAQAIHSGSTRFDRPFVAINCGALAEGVLESELFGHERGAFTGSVAKREGLFHKADGGTIFLDEIGETRPDMQVKLLRVLEDGTYYPVGSSTPRRANVRVVAATNRDLAEAIADRQFRDDLYYRISVVKIVVPSLMDRPQDIQPLLRHFWKSNPDLEYSDAALDLLLKFDWPGNVRQLRNFATRMAAFKSRGRVDETDVQRFIAEQHVGATHLPVSTGRTVEEAGQELIYRAILSMGNEIRLLRDLITSHLPSEVSDDADDTEPKTASEARTMDQMEKVLIAEALQETDGNRKEAARRLGIGERTLYRKLTKYGLN